MTGVVYVKNYEFDFTFNPPWGRCSVVMTSVTGHLTVSEFEGRYKGWQSCQPVELFDAPIVTRVPDVRFTPSSAALLLIDRLE